MKLVIVSHVTHYQHASSICAYGPYAREIDIWADLFAEVVIAAPLRSGEIPPGDCLPLTRKNISIVAQKETGGNNLSAKVAQILALPALISGLTAVMRSADAIHVRCPGNLGLLGLILAPLFSRRLIAKFAGQWNGYPGEELTVRLQRAILRSSWWKGPVTVYGCWPKQPPHVIPFFTSMMADEQIVRAQNIAESKSITSPLRVLFCGRLAPEKRVDSLLHAIKLAVVGGLRLEVAIVGNGPERTKLFDQASQLGIVNHLNFVGAVSFEKALKWYEWAHCLVLPSTNSEGWPKVVAEAMCHGVLCIAVEHGQVPAMLKAKGILLKHGSPHEIAGALQLLTEQPERFVPLMRAASQWAQQYSLEGLREALATLLLDQWEKKTGQLAVDESLGRWQRVSKDVCL
jgi:glycosyltransferase involved in cell wall biosynthesis